MQDSCQAPPQICTAHKNRVWATRAAGLSLGLFASIAARCKPGASLLYLIPGVAMLVLLSGVVLYLAVDKQ